MSAEATGRIETRDDKDVLILTRDFQASIEDIWAAVTRPDRMAGWIGTWTGDPASGSVSFLVSAEGDVPAQEFDVLACDPPRSLRVRADGGGGWELTFALTQNDGATTFEFGHVIDDPASLGMIGPGWDYYLDRLVAAESGADACAIDFDRDYYPALSEYYEALLRRS